MNGERYFPEIIDERSSSLSLSPLTAIIRDLRRKNVVTATAASGQQMSLLDSSDPWGSSEALGVDENHAGVASYSAPRCSCSVKRTNRRRNESFSFAARRPSLKFSTPIRTKRNGDHNKENGESKVAEQENPCPICGKEVNSSNYGSRSPGQIRLSSWLDSTRVPQIETPKHAEALLKDTPQLRIISPASTDMQGAGTTSPNNLLSMILPSNTNGINDTEANRNSKAFASDYRASLARDRANHQAATELSSLLWILAHEMSLEDYGSVESEVFTSVFALVHSQDNKMRMAGLAALDALIGAPSADEEKKAIKFANTLSNGLRSALGDYEFLSAVSKALGHMATRTANVDFVESEVTRALEWLRTERSDRR